MLRGIFNERLLEYTEAFLGMLYLFGVIRNLIWFIKPLAEREEFNLVIIWFEEMGDLCKEKVQGAVRMACFWRRWTSRKPSEEEGKIGNWKKAIGGTRTAVRWTKSIISKDEDTQKRKSL